MTGRFDQKGDLWIEVEDINLIPHGVVRSLFTRSAGGRFGLVVVTTEINLTAYIADLVDRRTK